MNNASYLQMLMEMPKPERKVYVLTEKVEMEQHWLEDMLDDWRVDRSVSLPTIREQRRRVQLWQKRLNEAKAKLEKSTPSVKLKQS